MGYVFQPWSFLDISISLSYISGLKVVGIPPELGLRDNNRYHGDSPMPIAVRLFKKGTYGNGAAVQGIYGLSLNSLRANRVLFPRSCELVHCW